MHLRKIEIQGFKSFADKISISLGMGITSIVGPNGSGKSNFSDAVRWVLGEQSMKSLRGSRLEDVIFSGTEHRKPSGFAEVSLTIDNSDGGIPVPYAEVLVTRRVYRSGESEYLLNRSNCRLKDINEIFYDTGIGREGYTIIGQGKVDEILNDKPEERRGIFEEAAGIMKYKIRRQEAERKLEATSQNVLRIDDIIGELGHQATALGEQAETARRYLRLRDELKEIEVAGYVSNIGKYDAQLKKCESGLKDVKNSYGELSAQLKENEAASLDRAEREYRLDEMRTTLGDDVRKAESTFSDAAGRLNLNNEKISRAKGDIERVRSEIERASEKKIGHDSELKMNRAKLDYLSGELTRFSGLLDEKERLYESVVSELGESDRAIESLKLKTQAARDKYYDYKNKLSGLNNERDHCNKAIAAIEKNISLAIHETDVLSIEKDELSEKRIKSNAAADDLKKSLNGQYESRARLITALNEQRSALNEAATELGAKRSRLKILSEMERSFEGYYASVRRVLSECRDSPEFGAGIHGAVAALIEVPKRYETAITMVLGSAQQNIVTDDERQAGRAIEFLKRTSGGRATFLPISVIRGRTLGDGMLEKLAALPGYIGVASELIGYDPKYANIMRELLGMTVVADSLDDGLAMAARFRHSFRVVTLEGDIIAVGGAITGGSVAVRDSGIINRHRLIPELNSEAAALEEKIAGLDMELKESEARLSAILSEISGTEKALGEHRIRSAELNQKIGNTDEKLANVKERRTLYKIELDEANRGKIALADSIFEVEAAVDALEGEIAEMEAEIGEYARKNRAGQAYRDELLSDISAFNVSVASITEAHKSAAENIARLERELADSDRNIASREASILRFGRDIEKYEGEIAAIENEMEKADQQKKGVLLRIESAAAEKTSLREEARQLGDEATRINGLLGGVSKEMNRLESRAVRIKAELDHCKNRLWEDYELTYHNALALLSEEKKIFVERSFIDAETETDRYADAGAVENESGTGADRDDMYYPPLIDQAAAKRSAQIRDEMQSLGPVNVLAIDEYAATRARLENMERQKKDLAESIEKLKDIIAEMSDLMDKNFREQFDHINRNFDIVFKELFSGGRARLILTEGRDVLEAGVEIEIQLPGKRMQNMMLYSGGERALTAIALIFAMLKLKPVPFCLLDEIESALDEANVERFSRYIKKYSDKTQFILVTHRKGTMEGSNVLYGVTMQERGVSDVVSLRLSDAS